MSQKLSELKSKPLLDEPAEGEVLIPNLTHSDDDPEQNIIENNEHELDDVSKESFISSLQTKTSSEQLALDDCESSGEVQQEDEDIDYDDPSVLVLELVEESDDDVSNEIAEEMKNCEPSVGNTCECFKIEISEI